MRRTKVWLGVAVTLACGSPPAWDSRPPRLVATELSADGQELSLQFDEPVTRAEAAAGPPPEAESAPRPAPRVEGSKVTVAVRKGLVAGKDYRWTAEVQDAGANTTEVAGRFYGPNDHPAGLRLNELRVAGSGPHPDFIELRVEAAGSLGGWTLEYREAAGKSQKLVLDDREVPAGAVVLVYRKAPSAAKHPEAAAGAVVLTWPGDEGFSAVKGALLLRPAPTADPTDLLAWAAKAGQGRALAETEDGPEVDPSNSTATRTWCRDEEGRGWVLVANGSATPGAPNKLTAWEAPPASRKPPTKPTGGPGGRRRRRSAGPAGPWPRSGPEPGADGEAEGPAARAAGPRTTPPPGLRGSTALPREPRRRRRARRWEPVLPAGEDGEEAAARRPARRR